MLLRRLRSAFYRLIPWRTDRDGLQRRRYPSDAVYRAHQAHKVFGESLAEHDQRLFDKLVLRFAEQPPASPVLCLGARNGAEVRAFRAVGAWAIGVDLASSEPTPLVLRADFHALPFRRGSMKTIYSNAIDHVMDLDRYLAEIHGTLAAEGTFVLDAVNVSRTTRGSYEALWWPSTDALISRIETAGFKIRDRRDGKNWVNLSFGIA